MLKGLKLDKKLILSLLDAGIDDLTIEQLEGLPVVDSFNFSKKFRKTEFVILTDVMGQLFTSCSILRNLDHRQLFIINAEANSFEYDIFTSLNTGESKLFLNIEMKSVKKHKENSNYVKEKLNEQLVKHIKNLYGHLPDKCQVATLGFIDDNFERGYIGYFDYDANSEIDRNDLYSISSLNHLNELIDGANYDPQVVDELRSIEKIDNIVKVIQSIENGSFKAHVDTDDIIKKVKKHIEDREKFIIVNGRSGYGKTVVACKLFIDIEESLLLLMNKRFYMATEMNKYYSYDEKHAFFGTDSLLDELDATDEKFVVVIDEAQRVPKCILGAIIQKAQAVVWIGDFHQVFMPEDPFLTVEELKNFLNRNHIGFKYFSLRKPKRYDQTVDRAIKYILNSSDYGKELSKIKDYDIQVYLNEKVFCENIHELQGKLFTLSINKSEIITINDNEYTCADKEDFRYAISPFQYKFGLATHAQSFDVDHCFVYLKGIKVSKYRHEIGNKQIHRIVYNDMIGQNIDRWKRPEIERYKKLINQMYTLFTRGRKSLHIFCEDISVYLHLNKRIKKIS